MDNTFCCHQVPSGDHILQGYDVTSGRGWGQGSNYEIPRNKQDRPLKQLDDISTPLGCWASVFDASPTSKRRCDRWFPCTFQNVDPAWICNPHTRIHRYTSLLIYPFLSLSIPFQGVSRVSRAIRARTPHLSTTMPQWVVSGQLSRSDEERIPWMQQGSEENRNISSLDGVITVI